jgi:hypothetical protein
MIMPNPAKNPIPSLYDLSNATIGTKLEKKKRKKNKKKGDEEEEEDEFIYGWAKVSLSDKKVLYAALDARLGFEIARSHIWNSDEGINIASHFFNNLSTFACFLHSLIPREANAFGDWGGVPIAVIAAYVYHT